MINLRLLNTRKSIVPDTIFESKPRFFYYKITAGNSVYLNQSTLYQFGRHDYEHIHSWFDTFNDVILNLELVKEKIVNLHCGKTDTMLLFYNPKYERYIMVYKKHILKQYPQYFDKNENIIQL